MDGRLEAHSVGETELVATVAGERDSVTVEVLEPPEIELVDADLGAETAVEGTPLELELTHENAGGPGSETVEVSVGDDRVVHSTVRLDGGETATERLRWNAEDSGPVTVADADEPLGELTVVEPDVLALESIALPEEVPRDEPYGIDLEFDNELDRAVSERVELRVDGEEVTEEVVVVGAGGSTETITYDHDAVGTATHVVDRGVEVETGTVEILEPAKLAVDELAVPEAVNEGERGTVTATVTNVGGADGDGELVLSVDGEAAGSESISLEPGETDRIAFEASFDEHGAATVTVESPDDRRETSVTVDAPEETGEEDDGAADVGGDGDEGETTDAGNEADDAADETDGFGAAVALVAVLLALVTHTAVRRAAPSATSR